MSFPERSGPKKMVSVKQLEAWDGGCSTTREVRWMTGHWKILSWNDWKIFESDLTNKKQNMEAILGIINPENSCLWAIFLDILQHGFAFFFLVSKE